MNVIVILLFSIVRTSKILLMETKDSTKAYEVSKGMDYEGAQFFTPSDTIQPDIEEKPTQNIKIETEIKTEWLKNKYERHCTPTGKSYTGKDKPFCQRWRNKW